MRTGTERRATASQHERASARYLEHQRARLVRELAAVNAQLRKARPRVVVEQDCEEDWDFDPQQVSL